MQVASETCNSDLVLKGKMHERGGDIASSKFLMTKLLLYAKWVLFETLVGDSFVIERYIP